jgi:hypothetical protein
VRRRDDSFSALDRRARVVKTGVVTTFAGALVSVAAFFTLRAAIDIRLSTVLVFAGPFLLLLGIGRMISGWLDYRRYRRLLRDGDRDPWDPKTEPAEYGPWNPGDP